MASSKISIYSALVANLAISVTKFIAAAITGSSAMASEGIHSLVDTINEVLLLLGIKRSKKPPDAKRPFGYGTELYFWSFIVSILIFSVGGGISFYEGITHLQHPEHIQDPSMNYIVLGIALLFDGTSFIIALKAFNRGRNDTTFWRSIKRSKDPSTFVVLFEDAADVLGLIVAFVGIFLGHYFNNPYFDGIASIIIGAILTAVSVILTRESRSLLLGEAASPDVIEAVKLIAEANDAILNVDPPLSTVLGAEEILLILKVTFRENLTATQISEISKAIKEDIRAKFSLFTNIYIEVKS